MITWSDNGWTGLAKAAGIILTYWAAEVARRL